MRVPAEELLSFGEHVDAGKKHEDQAETKENAQRWCRVLEFVDRRDEINFH